MSSSDIRNPIANMMCGPTPTLVASCPKAAKALAKAPVCALALMRWLLRDEVGASDPLKMEVRS